VRRHPCVFCWNERRRRAKAHLSPGAGKCPVAFPQLDKPGRFRAIQLGVYRGFYPRHPCMHSATRRISQEACEERGTFSNVRRRTGTESFRCRRIITTILSNDSFLNQVAQKVDLTIHYCRNVPNMRRCALLYGTYSAGGTDKGLSHDQVGMSGPVEEQALVIATRATRATARSSSLRVVRNCEGASQAGCRTPVDHDRHRGSF
jgi:hypothetical protein